MLTNDFAAAFGFVVGSATLWIPAFAGMTGQKIGNGNAIIVHSL